MTIRILTFLTLTFSIFIFLYVFFKSEILLDGQARYYYRPYYIISILLVFLSVILFFLKEKLKIYIFIVLISLSFSLYSFEGYLSLKGDLFNKNLQIKRAEKFEKSTNKKFDNRNTYQIYKDLVKTNKNLVVSMHSFYHNNDSIYSLSGISKSKTIFCNENGFYSIYDSDRYGFNNPDIEWDSNQIEYLLLGDSFVHGACVNRPDDISSVLRKLSGKKVLNLGIRGNSPLKEYASLKEYLPKNTKKILWFYFEGNDLEGLEQELKEKFLLKYLQDEKFKQNLKFKQYKIDELLNQILKKEISKKMSIINFIKLSKLRSHIYKFFYLKKKVTTQYNVRKDILSNFKLVLQSANELAKENNSELYFVYLPGYERYINDKYINKNYDKIKLLLKDLNIQLIDIHKEVFSKEKEPLKNFPFELYGHYNVSGYLKVSEVIYKRSNN